MFTWTLSLWWGTHSQIHEKAGSPFMLFNMRSFSRSRIYIWNMRRTNLSASPRFKACQHDGDQDPKANQINMPMSVRYLDLSSDVQPPTATKWRKANKLISIEQSLSAQVLCPNLPVLQEIRTMQSACPLANTAQFHMPSLSPNSEI